MASSSSLQLNSLSTIHSSFLPTPSLFNHLPTSTTVAFKLNYQVFFFPMSEGVSLKLSLSMVPLMAFLLFLCLHEACSNPLDYSNGSLISSDDMVPQITPSGSPHPFIPINASSPLVPFTNTTVPKLSGLCRLNFDAAESIMTTTSLDCFSPFAPMLSNVMCCPQLEATLAILVGQSSKATNILAINRTVARHCLSDIDQILVGQGASASLRRICSVNSSNLTEATCPVRNVSEFENAVETSKLLDACQKIDPVKECCDQVCQNAISEAATKLALKASEILTVGGQRILPEPSTRVNDCKMIVHRWLASKLDPSDAKEVLRGISNCNINKVCPLAFPDMEHVAKSCGNNISNQTACCNSMASYKSHLQGQKFITNLQALDCATSLGKKLQKLNVTRNVYSLCHISLQSFSLLGTQDSGCLLPSLPSDATFDKLSGLSFICDLNDNIAAPWPSMDQAPASSCNKTIRIPALPAVASAQNGLINQRMIYYLVSALSITLMMLL
ncbi:LOW QUALITY PROTEIN: uncharacterized GPI-anchored protein At1g61900-like [Rutidosis leptorrhynchoides]|uniref:LOW QUALITY PROTEIN: uncharacterized GPI-anchored protein At1g61900-like n=1 Tax=Rutidosis leptorrhynchoides TaxID=125765 RepID=UPI003A990BCF